MTFAIVFPGQGSQSVGMMATYGDAPVVRNTFAIASEALGRDLWQLASEGPAEALSQTVNTQPLMLTAGVAVYRLWQERGGAVPAALAGHSLGEYSALVAAGALAFEDAVPLVEFRAKAMQEAVPAGEGAMAAVLGLADEDVAAACLEAAQGQVVEAVNFNAPGQTVIAGHAAAVNRAVDAAKARGAKRAVILPVSAPFHCSLMRAAADRLKDRLASIEIHAPAIPVINNVDVMVCDTPEAIRAALVRQAAAPVRWVEVVRAFASKGVTRVLEFGPGKVLAPLAKRIDGALQGSAIVDLASLDQARADLK